MILLVVWREYLMDARDKERKRESERDREKFVPLFGRKLITLITTHSYWIEWATWTMDGRHARAALCQKTTTTTTISQAHEWSNSSFFLRTSIFYCRTHMLCIYRQIKHCLCVHWVIICLCCVLRSFTEDLRKKGHVKRMAHITLNFQFPLPRFSIVVVVSHFKKLFIFSGLFGLFVCRSRFNKQFLWCLFTKQKQTKK